MKPSLNLLFNSPSNFLTNFKNVNIFLALWIGFSSLTFWVTNNLEGSIFTCGGDSSVVLASSFVFSSYSITIYLSLFIDIFIFDYDII